MLLFPVSGGSSRGTHLRTKRVACADVTTGARINPFRLTIGWLLVDPCSLPASSILFTSWVAGSTGRVRLSRARRRARP